MDIGQPYPAPNILRKGLFKVRDLSASRAQGLGFRFEGLGLRVQGLAFRVGRCWAQESGLLNPRRSTKREAWAGR